jgi:dTDP-4-dehydrorhamnose reductase
MRESMDEQVKDHSPGGNRCARQATLRLCRPLPQSLPSTPELPDIPLPLLITGVSGVAGYNAFHAYRQRYGEQVIGQRPVNNWPLNGPGIEACDLEDRHGVQELVRRYRFRSVLSCGGSCALKSCELDPDMARRVNVLAMQNLIDAMAGYKNRFVHLSIDLVFSGTASGWHRESDEVDPVTIYGKTMAEGEQLVLGMRPDACVLRISLPMGISFNGHAGAIDWIQSRFAAGKPATLYFDEVRTPTYVECLNRVMADVLSGELSGLFHCGGPRPVTLFQIAQIVNRVGGYPPELLHGCPRIEAGPMPPRAGDVTMDSSRLAAALGYSPFVQWPFDDRHFPTGRDWHFERKSGWRGSRQLLREVLYNRPHLNGIS